MTYLDDTAGVFVLEREGLLRFFVGRPLIRIEPQSFQWWKLALETEYGLSGHGVVDFLCHSLSFDCGLERVAEGS